MSLGPDNDPVFELVDPVREDPSDDELVLDEEDEENEEDEDDRV